MATDNNTNNPLEESEELINRLYQRRLQYGREDLENKKELLSSFKSIESSLMRQFSIMDNMKTNLKSTNDLTRELQKNRNQISQIQLREDALSKTVSGKLASQLKDQQNILANARKRTEELDKQLVSLKKQDEINKDLKKSNDSDVRRVRSQINKTSDQNEKDSLTQQLNDLLSKRSELNNLNKSFRDQIRDASKSYNVLISEEEKAYSELLNLNKQDIDGQARKLIALQQNRETLEEQNDILKQQILYSKQLDKSFYGVANNIVSALPKMGAISDAFEKSARASRETEEGQSQFAAGTKAMLGSALALDLLLLGIVDLAFKADEQVTNIAKSLGLSKQYAGSIREDFVSYSKSSGDAFINTNRLVAAQLSLTKELGVAVEYSGKQLLDYSKLTGLIGLNEQQAASIVRLGLINQSTTEDITKLILRGSIAAQQQYKVQFDSREILKEVSNLSAGILVKFQQNPEALGRAVVQAKALGTNLEKIDAIGDSLLDFEGSLERSLKAELITGRDLNLERARSAALIGDQQTLTSEIANQVGDLNSFTKLNVLAQRSLAEAFGLSRDELASMLLDQQKFQILGDVSTKTAQQQLEIAKQRGVSLESSLYQSLLQQSAQEKFNNTMQKLEDILSNIVAGPIGQMIDGLATILNTTTGINTTFGLIGGLIGGKILTGLYSVVSQTAVALGLSEAKAIADTTSAEAISFGAVTPIILGGLGAIAGAMYGLSKSSTNKVSDGIISPEGNVLYNGTKGSIQFDKNDTIVAGTNLLSPSNNSSNNSSNSNSRLDIIISKLEKLYQKDTNIYINENKIASVTANPIGTTIQKNVTSFA
jgi:hypothetical protein